jgi:hypothetical protein
MKNLARGIETRTPPVADNAMKKLEQRITAEPAYQVVLYKILALCETPRPVLRVQETVLAFPEMVNAAHSPTLLLGWLREAGGIESVVMGREKMWKTTPAGRRFVEAESPTKKTTALFAAEPTGKQIFMQVIEFCRTPRSRAEIEDWLDSNPRLEELRVRPTFFVERLEDAGGLEWRDKHWCATPAGIELLQS